MWSILALGAAEAIINRIIDLDAITRLKLNELHNQCLRVVIRSPNLTVDVNFDHDKLRFEPTPLGQAERTSIFEQRPFDPQYTVKEATATLQVSDFTELLKLLLSKEDELGNIPLQGDYHLLFSLKAIMAQVELDLASHLSPWIGATAAHEIGKLQNIPQQLFNQAKSAEFIASDFLKEDAGIFAARWAMDDLQQGTRKLNQETERLEAKLQQLNQQFDQKYPPSPTT